MPSSATYIVDLTTLETPEARLRIREAISRIRQEQQTPVAPAPVKPGPRDLLINIESERDFRVFRKQFEIFSKILQCRVVKIGFAESGPPKRHVHVRLTKPVTSKYERLLLQALLGSDLKRELLSWGLLKEGCVDKTPTSEGVAF